MTNIANTVICKCGAKGKTRCARVWRCPEASSAASLWKSLPDCLHKCTGGLYCKGNCKPVATITFPMPLTIENLQRFPDGTWIWTDGELTLIRGTRPMMEPKPTETRWWWRRKQLLDELNIRASRS